MTDTNTNGQHSQQPASSTTSASTDGQPTVDADDPKIMASTRLPTTATELGTDALDHFSTKEEEC